MRVKWAQPGDDELHRLDYGAPRSKNLAVNFRCLAQDLGYSIESPWGFWRLGGVESRGVVDRALVMVERLKLGWWHVANGAVQAPVIPPVDPLGRRELDLSFRGQ